MFSLSHIRGSSSFLHFQPGESGFWSFSLLPISALTSTSTLMELLPLVQFLFSGGKTYRRCFGCMIVERTTRLFQSAIFFLSLSAIMQVLAGVSRLHDVTYAGAFFSIVAFIYIGTLLYLSLEFRLSGLIEDSIYLPPIRISSANLSTSSSLSPSSSLHGLSSSISRASPSLPASYSASKSPIPHLISPG